MIYLAIDTCVWLELLKTDFNSEINHFDELLFWVEHDHLALLTTENLLEEWNRHKTTKRQQVVDAFKVKQTEFENLSSVGNPLSEYYKPERINKMLVERIERIDAVLTMKSHKAMHTDALFIEAAKRNLACIAPNHKQDSFRDTINILALREYVAVQGLTGCIFTTINHKDFGDKDPYNVHSALKNDFNLWKIKYVYFDSRDSSYSGQLFNVHLKPHLPLYEDFIKERKRTEEKVRSTDKKGEGEITDDGFDPNYIEYTMKIDAIIAAGEKRTKLDENTLDFLFNENPIYKEYFYRKITSL